MAMHKGEIVKRLLKREPDCDFIFCAGDDKTDEDMFRALKQVGNASSLQGLLSEGNDNSPEGATNVRVISCTIGPSNKKTAASWHVEHPTDLLSVLNACGHM